LIQLTTTQNTAIADAA